MSDPKPSMSTRDTLSAFSEWMDTEKINPSSADDDRTHDDLAQAFIDHWEADERGANLAGRAWERMVASVSKTFKEIVDAVPEDVRKSLGL